MARPPADRSTQRSRQCGDPVNTVVGMPSAAERPHDSTAGHRAGLGRVGFESGSDVYERARPGYPDEAVAHLVSVAGITAGSRVLDLAAGTGKFTRQIHATGARCLAAEPSASMREVFSRMVPGVPLVGAVAERIPVTDGAMDAVVVAQAFHWFDAPVALAEIARALRQRGWLGLIWNERDESDPMVAELVHISRWDRSAPYPVGMDFGAVIGRSGLFGPVERTKFAWVQWLDRPAFVDQVASRSYVQVLPPPEQGALLDRVAAFGSTLSEPIAMPTIADLFCAQVAG
jgi:SAM-dependent methyltransferase